MNTSKRFSAKEWVESEIQAMEDSYGNTREQAIEFVRDLLEEGEYREELSDRQVASARRYVVRVQEKCHAQKG